MDLLLKSQFLISYRRLNKITCTSCRFYNADQLKISRMLWPKVSQKQAPGTPKSKSSQLESQNQKNEMNHEMSLGSKSSQLFSSSNLMVGASPGMVYMLPFLTRALEKLHRIIDLEMQSIGAQKVTMPCLAPGHMWKESNRWQEMGAELFTLKDRHGKEHCLAPTHEEAVSAILSAVSPVAVRDLPVKLYQIGRKFRDEMRPKHGLLRGREFEMKDLYTFDRDETTALVSYGQVCEAYHRVFSQLGLDYVQVEADTGAMGGSTSHEFHFISNIGEDTLYKCPRCERCINKELFESGNVEAFTCSHTECDRKFEQNSGIEVAHAFVLGQKYSSISKATYTDTMQKSIPLYMACFGIGVTRVLAACVEVLSKDGQIRWPSLLAPHQICIIPQKEGYKADVTLSLCEDLHRDLLSLPQLTNEVVLDDRMRLSIGQRVKGSQHLGIPICVVAGKKALEEPAVFEVIHSVDNHQEFLTREQILNKYKDLQTIAV